MGHSRLSLGRLADIHRAAPLAALLILGLLVVLPLVTMLVSSLRPAGTLPFDAGPLTFSNFASVYLAPDTVAMLRNTALYAVVPIVLALPLAFILAFLTERTDLPLREAVYSAMFIPISIPVFASAMSWFLLLGPRAGTLNMWIRTIFSLDTREGPFNILTLGGMIFVHAIGIIPSMWLILISVLRVMPSTMLADGGGVISCPPRTMKMFSALPSLTWPSWLRKMASSKPFRNASVLASALFT